MVGVGPKGEQSALARVSIVNYHGNLIYDAYVLPPEHITDYRTHVSGITPQLLKLQGQPFKQVQEKVAEIIKNRIVVGHALKNDFSALLLSHPRSLVRDTSSYKPLRNPTTKKARALRLIAKDELGLDIQSAQHSSIEDAKAAMAIFRKHKNQWESSLRHKHKE
ncbi:ribonuclease H-like domain-containing protein [Gorgonomyces haynaldii]|nr:ribonuclease H-like domain-containing protein [Gorgonomyces haynaldii]